MPRRRLAKLTIEEQVAGLRRAHIAADEVRVPLDQRFGIGELGERTVGQIIRLKNAGPHTEERRAKRRAGVAPLANLARRGRNTNSAGLEPAFIVAFERLAIGVAKQAGTVADLGRDFGRGADRLVLRDEREPAAEGGLIGRVGQAEKVGCAVAEPVAPHQRRPGTGQSSWNGLGANLSPKIENMAAGQARLAEAENEVAQHRQGRERNQRSASAGRGRRLHRMVFRARSLQSKK